MSVRHVNPNAIQPVLDGIAHAEARPDPDLYAEVLKVIEHETLALARPTGRFLPAKRIAFAEGYIAAYRSAELPQRCRSGHTDADCGWCKGTGIQGGRP